MCVGATASVRMIKVPIPVHSQNLSFASKLTASLSLRISPFSFFYAGKKPLDWCLACACPHYAWEVASPRDCAP